MRLRCASLYTSPTSSPSARARAGRPTSSCARLERRCRSLCCGTARRAGGCEGQSSPRSATGSASTRCISQYSSTDASRSRSYPLQAVLERFYGNVALPLLSSLPSTSSASIPPLSTFLHAYTLVSSRAFQVSAFHPLALVPLADAFNHSDPPHVHLASDAWVCPECGKLGACEHDDEGEPGRERESALEPPRTSSSRDEADTVDMVCERGVEPGDEVFNTYGGALSNAHLVAAYGFLLEGNEHDVVSFERRDGALETLVRLVDAVGRPESPCDELERELDELDAAWRAASADAPLLDSDHPLIAPLHCRPSTSSSHPDLFIDADARLSPALWLAVALVARRAASRTVLSSTENGDEPRAAKRARAAAQVTERGADDTLQGAVRLAELAGEAWRAVEEAEEGGGAGPERASADGGEPSGGEQVLESEALRWASVLLHGLCAARVEEQVEEARALDASGLYVRAEVRTPFSSSSLSP